VKRPLVWIALLAVALGGAAAWYFLVPRHKLPDDLLATVPADAYGVMRIHVPAVLASDAYKRLVVERGEAEGVERVTKACGFNPLERVNELVVFARPSPTGRLPRFAFVARGDLRPQDLAECVKKFTGADATKLKREDIHGIPTVASSGGGSRAAFIGRDGIVGGDADSVLAAVNTLLGKAPSIAGEPVLRDLYREIETGTDIALVARMPDEVRPLVQILAMRVAGGMLLPFTEVRALAANATLAQGKIAGGALLVTPDAAKATSIVELARAQVQRVLGIPGVNLTPAGGVLRGIQMEARADRATFTGSIKVSTVETLLELLPALQQLKGALDSGGDQPAADAQPAPADGQAAPDGTAPQAEPAPAASADAPKPEAPGKSEPAKAAPEKATPEKADAPKPKKESKGSRERNPITLPVEKPAPG
jgi:hypothetical protein